MNKWKRIMAAVLSAAVIVPMNIIPIKADAQTIEKVETVTALSFDFNNEINGTAPSGFFSNASTKNDTFPSVSGMGKVYQIVSSTEVINPKYVDVILPEDGFEISTKFNTKDPSGTFSSGVFILTDAKDDTVGTNFLAIRPVYDNNTVDLLANNGSSTVQKKTFDLPEGLVLEKEKWYGLRAVVDNQSLTVYITDGNNEYKVIDNVSEVSGISVSEIAKYAHNAGLRPYGSTCQYDDFAVSLLSDTYTDECENTLTQSETSLVITDANASGGSAVEVKGASQVSAEFVITPPAVGTYDIYLTTQKSPENGSLQLEVYGENYASAIIGGVDSELETVSYQEEKVGSFVFVDTNPAKFKVTILEKAENAEEYKIVLDKIVLKTQLPSIVPNTSGDYVIREDKEQQTIWGLGVEIQSDSIESGNKGINDSRTVSVPHDLVQSERDRLATDLLKGFRYVRIAGGLFFRGSDPEEKTFRERWDTQNEELKEMIEKSGIEGIDLEYWSPLPYWKASGSLMEDKENGLRGLKCFGEDFANDPDYHGDQKQFLEDFGEALCTDIQYLEDNIAPVLQFSLQNEPNAPYQTYPSCGYEKDEYYETFKVVAPMLMEKNPDLFIHADGSSRGIWESGQHGWGKLIAEDPVTRQYVGGWSVHRVGSNSDEQYYSRKTFNENTYGKPVFNSEFEYLSGGTNDWRCINTAQSIMNWMTFENSPTWYWLHALKPTYNSEATGYSLGFWRPFDDEKTTGIEKGHWVYNDMNYNSIAGFLRHMPWDSVRLDVEESEVLLDNRIMSWKTPDGRMVFAVTNRRRSTDFTFNVNVGKDRTFTGYLYSPYERDIELGQKSGEIISTTLEPLTIQFWVEEPEYIKDGFSIDNITKADESVTVDVTFDSPMGASVAVAMYDIDGKLIGIDLKKISETEKSYQFNTSSTDGIKQVKAFVFDSDNITPLCRSKKLEY